MMSMMGSSRNMEVIGMECTRGWDVGNNYDSLDERIFDDQILIDFLKSNLHLSFVERYVLLKNLSSLIYVNFSIFSLNS